MKSKNYIAIVCYGSIEFWESRDRAIAFYKEGGECCEGCESERYWHIVGMLMDGANFVNDNDYYDAKDEFFNCREKNNFMVFKNGTNIRDKGGRISDVTATNGPAKYKRLMTLGDEIIM